MERSGYQRRLIDTVIKASVADSWKEAVLEWDVIDCEEDSSQEASCICGKENLRYLFTISNSRNSKELFPIGSKCIRKFNRDDLNRITSVNEQRFNLLHAVEKDKYIDLSSEYFSRRLLEDLLDKGAFTENKFNGFNGENDYRFMLDMFNKHDKFSISPKQQAKISAIILSSIKPFLENELRNKIK